MNSKPSFREEYEAYLSSAQQAAQLQEQTELEVLELESNSSAGQKVAGPCNTALPALDVWTETT